MIERVPAPKPLPEVQVTPNETHTMTNFAGWLAALFRAGGLCGRGGRLCCEAAEWLPAGPPPRSGARAFRVRAGRWNNALFLKRNFENDIGSMSVGNRCSASVVRSIPNASIARATCSLSISDVLFDAGIIVHDAIMYMTSAADLGAAIRTAYRHCRAGGGGGDYSSRTACGKPSSRKTGHGGHDGADGRSPSLSPSGPSTRDPADTTYRTELRDRAARQSRRHANRATIVTSRVSFHAPSGCASSAKPDSRRGITIDQLGTRAVRREAGRDRKAQLAFHQT